jgi:hypothetical protein
VRANSSLIGYVPAYPTVPAYPSRRHERFGETGRWLASVVRGWLGYHAVPDNYTRLDQFVAEVTKL